MYMFSSLPPGMAQTRFSNLDLCNKSALRSSRQSSQGCYKATQIIPIQETQECKRTPTSAFISHVSLSLNMTPRSPKPSKTSTISRRLRSRAEQNLSVQPPEIPQIRNLRSRRAAAHPSSSQAISSSNSVAEQEQEPVWTAAEILDPFLRGTTSDPVGFAERPDADSNLLLSQTLDLPPFPSSHPRTSNLSSLSRTPEAGQCDLPPSSGPDLLSSHLTSLHENSPGEGFSLRLSAEPELHSNPSVELRDMRWVPLSL